MNVQDVIERALAGNDGIPVEPTEHSSCVDEQVEKLAAALNFIGTNLESSLEEVEKSALYIPAAGALGGGISASHSRDKMRRAGMSEDEIDDVQSTAGGAARGALKTVGGATGGYMLGALAGSPEAGAALGGGLGGYLAYKGEKDRGRKALRRRKNAQDHRELEMRRAGSLYGEKKYASADDALYHAAQVGKQSLLEKVAEDRISPAKISAGPAAPYSGEIMPNPGQVSNEFIGNTRDHHALIALKAQKVRDRVNKDMKQYVNNVGDGYNLQGHLNKMNK